MNFIFILCQWKFNHNSPNFHKIGESVHCVNGNLITFLQWRIFSCASAKAERSLSSVSCVWMYVDQNKGTPPPLEMAFLLGIP